MSAEKHAWRLKRREVANHDDIRYLGPLSYRAFEILGWLCIVLSVAVVALVLISNVKASAGSEQSLPLRILPYAARMSALFLVIAGISRAMRGSGEYRQQLLTYLGLAGIVAAGSALVFQHTVMAVIGRLFLEPKQVMPLLEKSLADITGNGFIAYNVFVDIFLCILLFFFVNVRPKHVFTGRWTLVLRACAALPVAYAVACLCLKCRSVCDKTALPFWCFPILTVKPVTFYGLFLFLAIYVKRKEIQFCRDGQTYEACQASLGTRRNSLRFGIVLAIALAVAAIVDNLLQYGAAQLLLKSRAPEGADALAWGLQAAKRIGFGGDSLVLLVAAPFMLLYSFNRVPKWRIFSVLAPLLAIALAILLWRGSLNVGAGDYIVEGKIPKLSVANIQQVLEYVKKANALITALFSA